jgi:hypothetical protein
VNVIENKHVKSRPQALIKEFFMFLFPVNTVSELVRNNIEAQLTLVLNMSRNCLGASTQLGKLNVQAGRKLMEESSAALKNGLELRTLADTQTFFAQQSQATVDRLRGYALNVQNITTGTWIDPDKPDVTIPAEQPAQAGNQEDHSVRHDAAATGQHETGHRPSPLVEKLVASVASSTDKLH